MALPLERGEVSVVLGELLSLRSRSDAKQTGIRVQFGGVAEAPPVQGLIVTGRAARVDALDWIGVFAKGDASGTDGSMSLKRIDVNAGQMRLLGADFAGTRLLLVPAKTGTAVQVQGAGIAGSLLVPQQDGAQVAGRFDRLYWRKPAEPPAPGGHVAVATQGNKPVAFDPANIPPMLFEVADLRIGDAELGSARFRSTPVASGLRMDEFSARSPKQRMSASGSWTGRNEAVRTQVRLDVDSDDIGVLLAGLGLAGQVDGGKGKLGVQASWRGGPEAFDPMAMQASVSLDARDGRLLELEPGAGRVLGLLGIAQLPRRLTLDFRDFFEKGFAFDHITGDVRLAQGSARHRQPHHPRAGRGPPCAWQCRLAHAALRSDSGSVAEVGWAADCSRRACRRAYWCRGGCRGQCGAGKPLQGVGAKTYRVTGPWASPTVEVTARSDATEACSARASQAKPAQARTSQAPTSQARASQACSQRHAGLIAAASAPSL